MRSLLRSLFVVLLFAGSLRAQDTLVVQTFTFDAPSPTGFSAPYRGTFQFPDTAERFEKILMYYTLKCDAKTAQDNYPCGEWDYLTYTVVVDSAGIMDSSLRTAPRFSWVTGGAPDSFASVNSPTWTYLRRRQKTITYTDTLSILAANLGTADHTATYSLPGSQRSSQAQFLWRAGELTAAGLSAGDLSGLKLDLSQLGSEIRNLRISLSATTLDSLDQQTFLTGGFSEAYFRNTSFPVASPQDFLFHTPFAWDGLSNIVVTFSFDHNNPGFDTGISMDSSAFPAASFLAGTDGYLQFNGSTDYVNLGSGPQIKNNAPRTIECWVFTEAFNGGGVFEAGSTGTTGKDFSLRTMPTDNVWRVQLWGTPDFDVTVPGSKLAWRHFAVTFDGSITRLYVDGILVGQKSFALQTGANDLLLGSWGGTRFQGKIDEVRVWNKALSQSTIRDWHRRSFSPNHPEAAHLVGYYPFNEAGGVLANDASGQQPAGQLLGLPTRLFRDSHELLLDRNGASARPAMTLVQGQFASTVTETFTLDSLPDHAAQLILFDNPSGPYIIRHDNPLQPTTPTDTLLVWEANRYSYVLDENGQVVDSVFVPADTIRYRNDHRFFSNIVEYEILRFITPYGINLNLGPQGRTWIYDVTDYAPLLRNSVYLRAGNNQELLDLKFVMIKGTPPREVKKIENLWSGSYNYSALLANSQGGPVSKVLDTDAAGYRIKTRTSGHGFGGPTNCAEFCPRDHYLDINGNRLFSWLVWNECATNEIYPQGGTWVYDRAGWCPGEEVSTFDHELTAMFNPGDTLVIDYALQNSSPPEGNFVLEGQLLTYGAPNRSLDAGIEKILSPNSHFEYSRRNPICGQPKIQIRNSGATTLTTIDFTFGVIGGFMPCYYRWNGSLDFLESEEIELPLFNWTGLDENDPRFYVEINSVNGSTDENTRNDYLEVPFEVAPRWTRGSILEVKTNAAAVENRYQIINMDDGSVVLDRKNLFNNTIYRDSLNLPDGCYLFHLIDEGVYGNDGLSWWANNDGNGYARLLNPNGTTKQSFQADFGADIYEQFTMGWTAGKEAPRVTCAANGTSDLIEAGRAGTLRVYPNPAQDRFSVTLEWAFPAPGELMIYDQVGKLVHRQMLPALPAQDLELELSLPAGLYVVVAKTSQEMISQRLEIRGR